MKKNSKLLTILTMAAFLLGLFTLGRTFSELTHHTGTAKSVSLHLVSAVLWFAVAWFISQRQKRGEREDIPPTELALSIQKKLALPYKLLPDKVPPDTLMRFFRRTRKEVAPQGFTPLLVPVSKALDDCLDAAPPAPPADETALAADPTQGKAILERRWQEAFAAQAETPEVPQTVLGEIAGGKEQVHFLSCKSAQGAPREALLFRLPTSEGWRAPAYLPFGGSGSMPGTEELLAVCKYWYDKYRAVPAAMGYGTMEFILPKAVEKERAMEAAKEHFAFCPPRVLRDTASGTIGELADVLWQSSLWYFRWDAEPEETEPAT